MCNLLATNLKHKIMGKNQHVMYRDDHKWVVKGEGNSRVTRVFKTQNEAVAAAREISKHQKSELIVHKKDDNAIRQKDSFGNDPKSIKG